MRILIVSDYFYPFLFGGGERRMYEIGKRLAKKHEVHVLTRRLAGSHNYEEHEGMHIHRIFVPSREITLESFLNGLFFMIGAFLTSLKLGEFDVYAPQQFFPLPPVWLASKVRKRPIVATIHDVYADGWIQRYGLKGYLMAFFEKIMLRLSYTIIVTVSDASKEKIMAAGVPEKAIKIIPNGVDLAEFEKVRVEKSKKPRIVYLGRLVEYKHVDDLLRAFSGLNLDAELFVIGEGPERENLKNLARNLGIENKVFFMGFVGEHRKIELLKSAHVLALPSTVEGFAIVLIEAMAAGTPVIAADIPAVHMSVKDEVTGLFFRPRNVDELKAKLERLLTDSVLWTKLSRNGYELVREKFSWEKIANEFERTLNEIIAKVEPLRLH
jgi:glycosyltransferase involved in cell wall biosynthesis